MAALDIDNNTLGDGLPIVYVLSDFRGETGIAVVKAAAAQFGNDSIEIVRVPNIKDVESVRTYFNEHEDAGRPRAVFHTFADGSLRREIRRELDQRLIPSIDLLGPAVNVLSTLTGEEPSHAIGASFEGVTR
ncbi:MAG: kinase/pyrophosphorylase [Atopobiaceae bacterium]|nr:kinase/pyrophosphorylase [Atopobiaceae bacterium]